VTSAIEGYRFNEAADGVYQFVWNTFCDWYLELAKPVLIGEDEAAKAEVRATAAHVLDVILRLLHPFMPYSTEALRAEIGRSEDGLVALSEWPRAEFADDAAAAEINWLVDLVTAIRSVRAEMNVPPAAKTPLVMVGGDAGLAGRLERHEAAIQRMARVEGISTGGRAPQGSAQIVVGDATAALPLAGIIDFAAERTRLEKEIARIQGEIARLDKKLGNEGFIARAPEEVVEAEREKRAEYEERGAKVQRALEQLPSD
jgi:valyl-tRNA synthetase